MFFSSYSLTGQIINLQSFPETNPTPSNSQFVPKIFGYKIYQKKGSKYEEKKESVEISHYDEDQLKKMKSGNSQGAKLNKNDDSDLFKQFKTEG